VKPRITFSEDCKDFVLGVFGLAVNRTGLIIYKETRQPLLGLNDKPVKAKDFAGIVRTDKGARAICKDIVSLIEASDLGLI
jgi:hypothetical protein